MVKSVLVQVCQQLMSDDKNKEIPLHPFHLMVLDDFEIKIVPLTGKQEMPWALFAKYYMSPEAKNFAPESLKSQIYSLGCILYHMASNRDPRDEALK